MKARFAEIETNLHTLAQAEERYYLENGEYASDLSKLDIEVPECKCIPGICETCQYRISGEQIRVSGFNPWGPDYFMINVSDEDYCGEKIKRDTLSCNTLNVSKRITQALGFTRKLCGSLGLRS